jgi:hypothetical protein
MKMKELVKSFFKNIELAAPFLKIDLGFQVMPSL